MWILLVASLIIVSALTIIQTPREWLKHKVPRILLMIYHTIGLSSIFLILFVVYRIKDGVIREAIIWTETCYFTLTMYSLVLSTIRYLAFEHARHFKHKKVLDILKNHVVFYLVVVGISIAYMIPSTYNALNIRTVKYDITIEKNISAEQFKVALVSDFHVGAGARHKEMDKMVELLTSSKPDLILIGGDVCDSSSSLYDLEYLESTLKKLDCKFGVYYAEGNHEVECRYDVTPYLERAGVTILKDKGIKLENGVNIIGRMNSLSVSTEQIMEECGLTPSDPTIVLQHQPKDLENLGKVADLVLCGHTHGYQFPFLGILMPYDRKISFGHRMFGDANVIVSAGVAEWGYRTKWPSKSDVTIVNINFKEVE